MAAETWYVWLSEYPDEGSVVVTAETQQQAIEEGAELLDTDPESVTARRSHEQELQLLRAERDRLAQELEASQGREALARRLLTLMSDDLAHMVTVAGDAREGHLIRTVRIFLADPSPAAEAIGRVVEAAEKVPGAGADELMELCEAVAALQALRAGRAGEGE